MNPIKRWFVYKCPNWLAVVIWVALVVGLYVALYHVLWHCWPRWK